MGQSPGIEIERKFLLSGLPDLAALPEVRTLRIEQGYLDPPEAPDTPAHGRVLREGRIRRTTHPDGSIICHHTLKSGHGLVRQETERETTAAEFEEKWPHTEGQRIVKLRHEVPAGDLLWQVDEFIAPVKLVLAEVELPTEHTPAPIPTWLEACIVREVTDDAAYNNRSIARQRVDCRSE